MRPFQESMPTVDAIMAMKMMEKGKAKIDCPEESVISHLSSAHNISLLDIARERVDIISQKMHLLPDGFLEEVKNGLRVLLEWNGSLNQRERVLIFDLQNLVKSRTDLTADTLSRAHRVQLEILVAISTGISAYLNPSLSFSQTSLIEIFVYKRCRNIGCQHQLPADYCTCNICTNRKGFCHLCMCVICGMHDFEVNTCSWIGCNLCSHWTHTDCAIRVGLIFNKANSVENGAGSTEMVLRCQACNRTSELLGWVKDVFQHRHSSAWDREATMRELDFVSRIFHRCYSLQGRRLLWECENLKEKMNSGLVESTTARIAILMFFQELEVNSRKSCDNGEDRQPITPWEACNRITEVLQELKRKLEMVADKETMMLKKARESVEASDRELEEKVRELGVLNLDRQKNKLQIEELERMARLKQAEADIFQLKANEEKREVERLQNWAWQVKQIRGRSSYPSTEAEAKRLQYLTQYINLQSASQKEGHPFRTNP